MFPKREFAKRTLLLFSILALSINVFSQSLDCAVELKDESKGMHAVMSDCSSIGTFSLGGLYNGGWEKLTYFYPAPWRGTYITVAVDDKLYASSIDPRDGILMDQYLSSKPSIEANKVSVSWMLPERISVTESLELMDNYTLIHITIKNENPGKDFSVGARIHLDTMLGDNDGAPIYVPGDGLLESEKEYSGRDLDFRYWKAYNRIDSANIIATGVLNGNLTYPDKVVAADWKNSSKSAWDYQVTEGRSILGDSALLLYYNQKALGRGAVREILTGYGSGEPVLKKVTEITEIVLSDLSGEYCMGEEAVIKADAGSRIFFSGSIGLEIKDSRGNVVWTGVPQGILIAPESINSTEFLFTVPEDVLYERYSVSARVFDESGGLVDEKSTSFSVNASLCGITEEGGQGGINWALLILLFLVLVAIIAFIASRRRGEVIVKKVKHSEKVILSVYNNSEQTLQKAVFIDKIPEGAEVDILTLSVKRRGTKLTLDLGTIRPGERATLEYRIKGVNVVPRAVFQWSGGEKAST